MLRPPGPRRATGETDPLAQEGLFAFVMHTPAMEWVLIGLILGYVGLMALNLRAAHQSPEPASQAAPGTTADPGSALAERRS